jgi:hypothetical protein
MSRRTPHNLKGYGAILLQILGSVVLSNATMLFDWVVRFSVNIPTSITLVPECAIMEEFGE